MVFAPKEIFDNFSSVPCIHLNISSLFRPRSKNIAGSAGSELILHTWRLSAWVSVMI